MRLADRIYDSWPGRHGSMRIRSGEYTLVVESRELYTSYRLVRGHYYPYYADILRHDVRNLEPLPIRPAQIIHARTIPWFLWIYYFLRDALWNFRWNRENARIAKKEKIRQKAIRVLADKHMGKGRFGGRYNR